MYGAVVKSLSEAQPDLGVASTPVELHRYDDGREHDPPVGVGVGVDVGVGVVGLAPPSRTSCHCWLVPFQSEYWTMLAPSAVEAPCTSTALPLLRAISWM